MAVFGDGGTSKRGRPNAETLIELHISQHSGWCKRHREHGELHRTTQLLLAKMWLLLELPGFSVATHS